MSILVDIIMPTYNHVAFVGKAIESVLAQQTDFGYRLLIADDCSTDGTQKVIREYAERHPDKIQVFCAPVHLGPLHKERLSLRLFTDSPAKYIHFLDGDDYWTSEHKLQKQVNFLEEHPECSLCLHDVTRIFEDGSIPPHKMYPSDQKEYSTLEDVLTAGVFPLPCGTLFRNGYFRELPDSFHTVLNGDWMFSVIAGRHGDFGFLNEAMAVYRVHSQGIWSRLDRLEGIKNHIKTYQAINRYLDFKYDPLLSARIATLRESVVELNMQNARSCVDDYHTVIRRGEIKNGFRLLSQAIRSAPSEVLSPPRLLKVVKSSLRGILFTQRIHC
ncbi:MAG: glycosyltransferase [Acidobacteriota bacterium]|nr:glycosyltransferase [Acidobacteriota bacterium]